MQISNVRLGLATNSSSTHSIILCPDATADVTVDPGQYGWENFLLKTKEEKDMYLATTLFCNLEQKLDTHYAAYITNGLFGKKVIKLREDAANYDGSYYVDHQSLITLPGRYDDPKTIDLDFFREFREYVADNSKIAIAGGNDNSDCDHYGMSEDPVAGLLPVESRGELICVKDGEFWVLFNKTTGAKIRLSFTSTEPYLASSTPELVDVKITSFCPFEKFCKKCYQDSTLSGTHAEKVDDILQILSQHRVFEVAFGGGETTMHPHFPQLLRRARGGGIVPNFTTFHMGWAKNPEINHAVLTYAGGFALSVNGYGEQKKLELVRSWITENKYSEETWNLGRPLPEVSIQSVLGISSTEEICYLMQSMKDNQLRRLTLLGYKAYGRAAHCEKPAKVDMDKIFAAARENYIQIGMDTKAVQDYRVDLDKAGISNLLRTTHEGAFSMYIDAVEMKVAKDSYSDEKIPFNVDYDRTWTNGRSKENLDALAKVLARVFPFKN